MFKYLIFLLIFAVLGEATPPFGLSDITFRIFNGHDSIDEQFPYQVSLGYHENFTNYQHLCGGSIIASRTILTAAHCFENKDLSKYAVYAGSNKLNEGGKFFQVEKVIIHGLYNNEDERGFNDICLFILKDPINFSEKLQPIELDENHIGKGHIAIGSGWGDTSLDNDETPNVLQFTTLLTLSNAQCSLLVFPNKILPSQLCTYTKRNGGVYSGDSGGPLVVNGKQVGIASTIYPDIKGRPDVFTRISNFIDWINLYKEG